MRSVRRTDRTIAPYHDNVIIFDYLTRFQQFIRPIDPITKMATMEKKARKSEDTKVSAVAADAKRAKLGDDKPKPKYKAPKRGCVYEEETCRVPYAEAKLLDINLRPYIEYTDLNGDYHYGDTSEDDSEDDGEGVCMIERVVHIPRKFLIEVGKYPPPTAKQLADMPKP